MSLSFLPCKCYLIGLFFITMVVCSVNAHEQKIIEVSSFEEFKNSVKDFVTIKLTSNIIVPYEETSDDYDDYYGPELWAGINIKYVRGLRVEGNGFKIHGESENIPQNGVGPAAFLITAGDVTFHGLTVSDFGCMGGAIYIQEGAKVQIINSIVSKNRNCAGLKVFDGEADQPGHHPSEVVLQNVTIDDNTGNDYGGGIEAVGQYRGTDRTKITMTDCKLTNNHSPLYGGGMYVNGVDVYLKGVFFNNNIDGTRDEEGVPNDVYADMNADCHDCWSSLIDLSPCPEEDFDTIDKGPIYVHTYPAQDPPYPADPRSYLCVPK